MQISPSGEEEALNYRILVVSPWGAGGTYNGPTVLMNRLFEELSSRPRVAVDLLYRDRGHDEVSKWPDNAISIRVGSDSQFDRKSQLKWILRVRKFIRRHRGEFDLIHLHGGYLLNLLVMIGRRTPPPFALLAVLEGGDFGRPMAAIPGWVKTEVMRRVVRRADVGFALSHGIAREMLELGLSPGRVCELQNVVSLGAFARSASRIPPNRDRVRLGFVGKLGPTKQPHLLLAAVQKLRESGIGAHAIFVGPFADADYERRFRGEVERLGVGEFVTLTGYRRDVTSFLIEDMDIFVLPSRAEGMPGALAEAMASGLPSLVTDVGAMRSQIVQSGGGAVIEGSAEGIRQEVEIFVNESERWTTCSTSAREYAKKMFGAPSVADTYFSALKRISKSDTQPLSLRLN
jgi:glycosyltransferase involved in cell wall biosynthesis